MIRVKTVDCVALGMLAMGATAPASAEGSGFYADFDVGQARYPYSSVIHLNAVVLDATNPGVKDSAWDALIGYRLNPHLGMEVGYVSFGKGSATISAASTTDVAKGGANFKSSGPTLAV